MILRTETLEGLTRMGHIGKMGVFECHGRLPILGQRATLVASEDLAKEIQDGQVGISIGATPCITGLAVTTDNKIYLFHSLGDKLRDGDIGLINSSSSGLVGGGQDLIERYKRLLQLRNYKILQPPSRKTELSLVVVNADNITGLLNNETLELPRGVYYRYKRMPSEG